MWAFGVAKEGGLKEGGLKGFLKPWVEGRVVMGREGGGAGGRAGRAGGQVGQAGQVGR